MNPRFSSSLITNFNSLLSPPSKSAFVNLGSSFKLFKSGLMSDILGLLIEPAIRILENPNFFSFLSSVTIFPNFTVFDFEDLCNLFSPMNKILNSRLRCSIFFKINLGKLPCPKINIILFILLIRHTIRSVRMIM